MAPFALIDYRVTCGQREGEAPLTEATVKVRDRRRVLHTAAEGSGPVGALDAALRKALEPAFPQIADIRLVDYKVRILDGRDGTAAITRVLVDAADGERRWSTRGRVAEHPRGVVAALADGIEYAVAARPAAAAAVAS